MPIIVIGGHTRNIGKTSVVAGIIAAMPERRWIAIKITQFGHNVCSADGEPCDCQIADHTIAISEERERDSGTDSARYLAAGAEHSFWVRTRQGQLHEAMPRVRQLLASAENAIVESNSVLRFLRPDLFLSVLSPEVADFKESARSYLDRADALVLSGTARLDERAWTNIPSSLLRAPKFLVAPPAYVTPELTDFVSAHLASIPQRTT